MRIAKRIEFDAGHRIQDHDSKCRNLHGHRYVIEAEVEGAIQIDGSSRGMVLDFAQLKASLVAVHDAFDHRLILEHTDPLVVVLGRAGEPPVIVEGPPTAEYLAALTAAMIGPELLPACVVRVTIWETPTSSATWTP